MLDYIDFIKQNVSTLDACKMYGVDVDRKGFARCINHSEKTASMKIYPDDKGFHCFGCGCSGDVITFTRILFNIGFHDAIRKLNDDFSLGINFFEKIDKRKQLELSRMKHNRKRNLDDERKKKESFRIEYYSALEEFERLQNNLFEFFPKSENEIFHEKFVEAAQKLSYAQYKLDSAEWEMNQNEA